MSVGLVMVAAGNGTRMGGSIRKPYLRLDGEPILVRTLKRFLDVPGIDEMVLVVHPDETKNTMELLHANQIFHIKIIEGGQERQDSVQAGLEALSRDMKYVLIHDAARPFVSRALIQKMIEAVKQKNAIVPAIPVKDTVKVVQDQSVISHTPDRRSLWAAQTPQAFSLSLLKDAYRAAVEKGLQGTDDASILEEMGVPVFIVEGEPTNIKITTPEDILVGEVFLRFLEENQ